MIRSYSDASIICIEGEEFYLNYLTKNAKIIPGLIVVNSFVSGIGEQLSGKIIKQKGTARIVIPQEELTDSSLIKTRRLVQILEDEHVNIKDVQFIKIDTDGYDFNILLGNKEMIALNKPDLYFEYDILFTENDIGGSLDVIMFLEELGYCFVIYDNFGNLLQHIGANSKNLFTGYNHYLKSCKNFGGGINYFDIFATTDISICEDIVKNDNRFTQEPRPDASDDFTIENPAI